MHQMQFIMFMKNVSMLGRNVADYAIGARPGGAGRRRTSEIGEPTVRRLSGGVRFQDLESPLHADGLFAAHWHWSKPVVTVGLFAVDDGVELFLDRLGNRAGFA